MEIERQRAKKKPKFSKETRELSNYLRKKIEELGIDLFPRDWTLKNMSTAKRLLSVRPFSYWLEIIDWGMDNPYWKTRIFMLKDVEWAATEYERKRVLFKSSATAGSSKSGSVSGRSIKGYSKEEFIKIKSRLLDGTDVKQMVGLVGNLHLLLFLEKDIGWLERVPWLGFERLVFGRSYRKWYRALGSGRVKDSATFLEFLNGVYGLFFGSGHWFLDKESGRVFPDEFLIQEVFVVRLAWLGFSLEDVGGGIY